MLVLNAKLTCFLQVRDEHFLDQCCRDLCQMLKLQQAFWGV